MKFGFIVGSHRNKSQSAKIAEFASQMLVSMDATTSVYTLDLSTKPLPLWDEGVWNKTPSWAQVWDPIARELRSCDAFVVLAPEYSGMVPAALKNFFLLASKDEIGHKPGLIIAVSSGRGGSYPVAELRMSSYKNTRINWIPEHMIVRNAEQVLNDSAGSAGSAGSPQGFTEEDAFTRSRLDYCLRVLREYGKALKMVRDSGVLDYKTHPNGL
jgi:NAD(P)H-dependent FMN reductase